MKRRYIADNATWILSVNPTIDSDYKWHCDECCKYASNNQMHRRPPVIWFGMYEYARTCLCMECWEIKYRQRERDKRGRFV